MTPCNVWFGFSRGKDSTGIVTEFVPMVSNDLVTRIDIPTLAERKADIEVKGDAGAVELAVKAGEGYVADPANPKVDGTAHSW